MKKYILLAVLITGLCIETYQASAQDWPGLNRYRKANETLIAAGKKKHRVVLIGDSITDDWSNQSPSFFTDHDYINRGYGGQTTPQMLLRFRADVLDLEPEVVVLLAGTNDIAGNTGPATLKMIEDNIASMAELAKANHVKIVLCSVLPANSYGWKPDVKPANTIVELNEWIKNYAKTNNHIYVDYYTAMVDENKGLRKDLAKDAVHPNLAGYQVMQPLVVEGIEKAMKKKR